MAVVNKSSESFIRRASDARTAMAEIEKNIQTAFREFEDLTIAGVLIAAEGIKKRSQELCPVDQRPNAPHPGNLRDSAFVDLVEKDGKATIIVGYDRNNEAPYAVFVHEIMENSHKAPTQAKFLETALNEFAGEITRMAAEEVRKGQRS